MTERAIKTWLREWAEWYHSATDAYPGATPIWIAMRGGMSSDFGSKPPAHIDPPYQWMRRLERVMAYELAGRKGRYIVAARRFYLAGERIEAVTREIKKDRATAYRWVARGVDALDKGMHA